MAVKKYYQIAKDLLFPICRSITGSGIRKTLQVIKKEFPDLKIRNVRSGTKVFDWNVPPEWNIKDAYVLDNNNIKNIDDNKVFSITHNPLTIENEILSKAGLKCDGIYFYHFHALPPVFENIDTINFRKQSFKIENPNDWRGFFIASCFVVDCQKI